MKTSCGGNHRWPKSDDTTFSPHPAREVEILKDVVITEAAEPFEHVAPNEHRLIAEKPPEHARAQLREKAGRVQKS
ncbi:MAG: hypothetical protein M3505_11820 [Verrucomicrobiota bacterium]|nr:hypothetical protein [Verrucomicrobiota bacterium]